MMRHCDGTDPNLIRYIPDMMHPEWFVPDMMHPEFKRPVPCDCGLVFDDVYRLVIFPHQAF